MSQERQDRAHEPRTLRMRSTARPQHKHRDRPASCLTPRQYPQRCQPSRNPKASKCPNSPNPERPQFPPSSRPKCPRHQYRRLAHRRDCPDPAQEHHPPCGPNSRTRWPKTPLRNSRQADRNQRQTQRGPNSPKSLPSRGPCTASTRPLAPFAQPTQRGQNRTPTIAQPRREPRAHASQPPSPRAAQTQAEQMRPKLRWQ